MKKITGPKDVDDYIKGAPENVRDTLTELRRVIKQAAPDANERISYRMPFYEYKSTGFKGRLIYFAWSEKYIAVYIPPTRAGKSVNKLKKYQVTKSSFHFPLDEQFPFELIGKTVEEIVTK